VSITSTLSRKADRILKQMDWPTLIRFLTVMTTPHLTKTPTKNATKTRRLGLRYNNILFDATGNGEATELCVEFLQSLIDEQKRRIRGLTILHHGGTIHYVSAMPELHKFCMENPKSMIRLHMQVTAQAPSRYLVGAADSDRKLL
jgi:hypothetical protein